MGAGILALPVIMKNMGLISGSLLIIIAGMSSIYSVFLLMKTKDLTGK
jgi:amino acid permease